jgi:CDP-4-dehydro-6-deoxyglucose reductase
MPPVIWYPLQLKKIIQDTDTTWRFLFDLQSDDVFNYSAGQFLTCDLPTGEKRAQRWRSYSIANANQKNNEIEFCISHKPGGIASDYFFHNIKIGDTIKCKGPEGTFVLPKNNDLNLFLICTGTGIAPFRGMLQEMQTNGHSFQSVNLIFGTRKQADLIYGDDISKWNSELMNFNSHICLSRQSIEITNYPEGSTYYHGYVHEAYKLILKDKIHPKESYLFMLCGWAEMIDQAVITLFSEFGFSREQIRFELYG